MVPSAMRSGLVNDRSEDGWRLKPRLEGGSRRRQTRLRGFKPCRAEPWSTQAEFAARRAIQSRF
jgi:hypothetical protein